MKFHEALMTVPVIGDILGAFTLIYFFVDIFRQAPRRRMVVE